MKKSLLISPTTFEIFKFEDWPPSIGVKTKMDFHVSQGFLALGFQGKDVVFSDKAGPEPLTSSIRRGCSIHSANPTWTISFKPKKSSLKFYSHHRESVPYTKSTEIL